MVSPTWRPSFSSEMTCPTAPRPSRTFWVTASRLPSVESSFLRELPIEASCPCGPPSAYMLLCTSATIRRTSPVTTRRFSTISRKLEDSPSVALRIEAVTSRTFSRMASMFWLDRWAVSFTDWDSSVRLRTMDCSDSAPASPPSASRSEAVTDWMSRVIFPRVSNRACRPCWSMTWVISPPSGISGALADPTWRSSR